MLIACPTQVRLRPCAGCEWLLYCGKDCQTADWHFNHRNECKKLKQGTSAKELKLTFSRQRYLSNPEKTAAIDLKSYNPDCLYVDYELRLIMGGLDANDPDPNVRNLGRHTTLFPRSWCVFARTNRELVI